MFKVFKNIYLCFISKLFSCWREVVSFIERGSTIITKVSALLVDDVADAIGESGMGKHSVVICLNFYVTIAIRA